MKLIGLPLLVNFYKQYPDSQNWLQNWIADAKTADWKTAHEVKARYPTCSFIGAGVAFFNVRGNNYRMEVHIAYNTQILSIQWIGTPEGQAWSKGTVGGSLCQIVLAIPK